MKRDENGVLVLEGVLTVGGGEFWLWNQQDGWACPLVPGACFEVQAFGGWHAVRMCCGGYHGRYLRFAKGGCVRPALCMRGRLVL